MTNRTRLFELAKQAPPTDHIPTVVKFGVDKRTKTLKTLSTDEKMLCALRKVLAQMTSASHDYNYYIASGTVRVLSRSGSPPTPGGRGEYTASGRFKLGKTHGKECSSEPVHFTISFRDTVDYRGLADVEYFDPTVIDSLPPGVSIDN